MTARPTTAGVFGIERITATDSGSSDSNVATVTPAATDTTTVPGSSASAISREQVGHHRGLHGDDHELRAGDSRAVRRGIRLGRIRGDALEPGELGGLLGGAVRGADAAVDHDARLQQPGDDRAGHRTGAEERDRGQCSRDLRQSCDHPRIAVMSASGGTKAIIAAFLANTGIALTKFIAWFFSGSASMLAEGVHSVADAGNQLLLILGGPPGEEEGRQGASVRLRPRAVRLRVRRLDHPVLGRRHLLDLRGHRQAAAPARARRTRGCRSLVLSIAIVLESFSLRTAVKESNHVRGRQSWVQFVRRAKAPELPVVLLEDIAALIGLVFAFLGVGLT